MTQSLFTVVTVSIPERAHLLPAAIESVRAQTYGPVPHLIRSEEPDVFGPAHVARQRNAIQRAVRTSYIAVLDDDDTFEPTYLERMAQEIEGWDPIQPAVVYSYCHGHSHAEGPFDPDRLQLENYIDGEAVINCGWLDLVGGYPVNEVVEDWQLYKRIHELGGQFVCVPERLRYHGRSGIRNVTN